MCKVFQVVEGVIINGKANLFRSSQSRQEPGRYRSVWSNVEKTIKMKYKFIIILLFISFNYSCSQKKVIKINDNEIIKAESEENGKVENGLYTCTKINWSIKIPEKHTITEITEIEKLNQKGNSEIKKNISEKSTIQERIHLIAFSFNSQIHFQQV